MELGYKKLDIYKLAHLLAVRVHQLNLKLPHNELYEEGSQIRRSSKSISTNIVEGYALRKYKNEYLHPLYRAYGSSEETSEHLQYLFDMQSMKDNDLFRNLSDEYRKLNGMLFRSPLRRGLTSLRS